MYVKNQKCSESSQMPRKMVFRQFWKIWNLRGFNGFWKGWWLIDDVNPSTFDSKQEWQFARRVEAWSGEVLQHPRMIINHSTLDCHMTFKTYSLGGPEWLFETITL